MQWRPRRRNSQTGRGTTARFKNSLALRGVGEYCSPLRPKYLGRFDLIEARLSWVICDGTTARRRLPREENSSADDARPPAAVGNNPLGVFQFEQRLNRRTLVFCVTVLALGDHMACPIAKISGLFGGADAVVEPGLEIQERRGCRASPACLLDC